MATETETKLCTLIEAQHREVMAQLRLIQDRLDGCYQLCEAHADNLVDVAAAAGVDPAVAV